MFIVSLAVACTYSDLLHGQWIFRAVIGQFQVRMYPYGPLALDHRSTEKKSPKNTLVPTLMALMNRKNKITYTMCNDACGFSQILVFWILIQFLCCLSQ